MVEVSATERYILQFIVGGGREASRQAVFEYYERRAPSFARRMLVSRRGVASRMWNGLVAKGLVDSERLEVTKLGRQVASGA